MRFFLCLLLFIGCTCHGSAQTTPASGPGKIKGRVVDSATKQPIGYATVVAFSGSSANVAGGMITDEKGQFTIDNLAPGEYKIKIDFLGYNSTAQSGIVLTAGKPTVSLGNIRIGGNSKTLDAVTITGSKNFMENHLDKFVYNVEKDVTSQGGVATDALKKVPQVSVDVDGNVELLGNGNVRVFINGKPSSLFDNNLADALRSIPASQIKSIEIITSPGAQYDAQGTGGIINIILKDNKSQGVNGNISATAATRLENVTGNIHVKKGAVDASASMLANYTLPATTPGSLDRQTDSLRLIQNSNGTLKRIGALPVLGMDWAIDKNNDIAAGATYSYLNIVSAGDIYQDRINNFPYSDTQTLRNSGNNGLYRSLDMNVNYRRKFQKEGQELNLGYQYNNSLGNATYNQLEHYTLDNAVATGGSGADQVNDKETYINVDYAHPLGKDIVLNVGVKGTFSRVADNSVGYSIDTSAPPPYPYTPFQQNRFIYNRDVYAAYVSATFPLWDVYQVKLGLRDEETITNMPGDTVFFHPSYNFLAPSFVISRKLKNNQSIKLSYSKRLQRPGYNRLNPFVDATDPSNLIRGNPALRPEKVDNVELSYYKFFDKGGSILVTLYEKYQRDDNQTYIQYYTALPVGDSTYHNVAVITSINASLENMAGINISGNISVSQKFELRGSLILFDKYIISNIDSTITNSLNYRINGNASYQFSKTLVAEVFYSFRSRRTEIQGYYPSYSDYSIAIRKMFLDKKLGVAFTTTDPFNRYTDQATSIKGQNFTIAIDRKIPNRSFGINISYKFGKMEYKEKKQEHADMGNDEGN